MNTKTNNNTSGGIGVLSALGIVFVALKLCGVISWSWWWVTLPFWGGIVGLIVIVFIVALAVTMFESTKRSK